MQAKARAQIIKHNRGCKLIGGFWLFQGAQFIVGGRLSKVIREQIGAGGTDYRRSSDQVMVAYKVCCSKQPNL
jgi:hypothetical protein